MRTCSLCGTRQDISGSQWSAASLHSWIVITQCNEKWKLAHDTIGRCLGYQHDEADPDHSSLWSRILYWGRPVGCGKKWISTSSNGSDTTWYLLAYLLSDLIWLTNSCSMHVNPRAWTHRPTRRYDICRTVSGRVGPSVGPTRHCRRQGDPSTDFEWKMRIILIYCYFWARSANLPNRLNILPSVISLFPFLNRSQFSQSFHHMKAFLVKLTDLNLVFNFSRDVAMATNFGQNYQIDLYSWGWCFATVNNMEVYDVISCTTCDATTLKGSATFARGQDC